MDRCTLGAPFFLSFYIVVYIINSATETVVRRDVPPSPRHITLIEYDKATSLPVFPLISTPQELLVSLNFNTRRNLQPSCILLPLNVNHRMRETPPTWHSAHPFMVSMQQGRSTLFNAIQEGPLCPFP